MIKQMLINIYEKLYEINRIAILRIKYRLNIMNSAKTIKYIKTHNYSIARFGDGEFNLIMNSQDINFQKRNPKLSEELKNVLKDKNENLLLCIPYCLNSLKNCNKRAKKFWIDWGKNNHHKEVVNMIRNLSGNYHFGDAQITRPYIDWKSKKRADYLFPLLKSLWDNKDILIVEGEQTRLGVGNDLFDNSKSIKRILAPAVNAFDLYNDILDCILEVYDNELIVIALGPTATILAADLSKRNVRALDIGHLDIEYEWYLSGTKEKTAISGKYTNEAKDGLTFSECKDEKYNLQIIKRIGC